MPLYGASSPSTLDAGHGVTVWNAETLTLPGQAKSQAVTLRRNGNLPGCVAVELAFSADPGAFSISVEFADTDEDKYYIARSPAYTTGLNSDFVGRIEFTNVVAKHVRLNMGSRANAVAVTAKIS